MSRSPKEKAQQAYENAVRTLEEAEATGDKVKIAVAEDNALAEFVDDIAQAVNDGLKPSLRSGHADRFAKLTQFTKTEVSGDIETAVSNLNAPGEGYMSLNTYLEEHVDGITVIRSTDHKQSALYSWRCIDPEHGRFFFETGHDTVSNHGQWFDVRDAVFDSAGVWTHEPPQEVKNEWHNWIGEFIDRHSVSTTETGPRTLALYDIQNYIGSVVAYPDVEYAVEYTGVYMDGEPGSDGEDAPTELWVNQKTITHICEDVGITPNALLVELEGRGLTVDGRQGASDATFVDGKRFTYWVLSPDIATPKGFDPNPQSPFDSVASEMDAMRVGDRQIDGLDSLNGADPDSDTFGRTGTDPFKGGDRQ